MVALDVEVKRKALEAARILGEMTPVCSVYVFGSRVEGDADEWSDIDVALFLEGIEGWDMDRRACAMYQVQKGAGLEVEAHLFPARALICSEEASFASYIMRRGVRLGIEGVAT